MAGMTLDIRLRLEAMGKYIMAEDSMSSVLMLHVITQTVLESAWLVIMEVTAIYFTRKSL